MSKKTKKAEKDMNPEKMNAEAAEAEKEQEQEIAEAAEASNMSSAAEDAAGETRAGDESASEDNSKDNSKEETEAPKKDKKDEKIEELTDRLQRSMAEFDNYRKRTEKEKASMYMIGAKEVVEKILPVIDNFERALASTTEEQKANPFVDGMEKIYKHFCKTLEDMGVTPIEAVGKEFNPNLHNAVMHVDDDEAGDNIIVEEFQKGYIYKDFVVRYSMVKVAN